MAHRWVDRNRSLVIVLHYILYMYMISIKIAK